MNELIAETAARARTTNVGLTPLAPLPRRQGLHGNARGGDRHGAKVHLFQSMDPRRGVNMMRLRRRIVTIVVSVACGLALAACGQQVVAHVTAADSVRSALTSAFNVS